MTLEERIAKWAAGEPSVEALVLMGSRVRASEDTVWRPDPQSDWDFQIFTTRPAMFEQSDWLRGLGVEIKAYAVRRTAIGSVPKIAVLFEGGEADLVIVPAGPWRRARRLTFFGLHRFSARLRAQLRDLAVVIRPGWKFLKGQEVWEPFYRRVVAEIDDPRLSDAAVRNLAESFVCDMVWTLRKIERGEFLAAQRMLHRSLVETNIRLLHELKLRRQERSFPEARRAERVLAAHELELIATSAVPAAGSLRTAVDKCAASCRELAGQLVGESWRWPAL